MSTRPKPYDTNAKVKVGENVSALIIKNNGNKKYYSAKKQSILGRLFNWL